MKSRTLDYALVLKLIVPILVVLAVAVYYLALRPTLNVYREYSNNCGIGQSNAALGVSPGYTTNRAEQVNKLYARYGVDTLSWKNGLWNAASLLSAKHGTNIIAYPGVRKTGFRGQQAFVQRISFSGGYVALVKLLQEAENFKHYGVVSAVRFARKPREGFTTLQVDFTGIHEQKLTHLP